MHDPKIYQKFNEILEAKKVNKIMPNQDEFYAIISYCLNSLHEEYQLILNKSYFENSYKFWWIDYFCKSSYYRKRFTAVCSFVSLFEMIYENFNDNSTFISFA